MSDENTVRLGNNKYLKIDLSKLKSGLKKEDIVGDKKFLESIFNSIDSAKNGDKPLGSEAGVLEQAELDKMIKDIEEAKGSNHTLSRREAKGLLEKWNLKGKVGVDALFVFLSRLAGASEAQKTKDVVNEPEPVKEDANAQPEKVSEESKEQVPMIDGKRYTVKQKSGKHRNVEFDQIITLEGSDEKRYYKDGKWVGGTDGFATYTTETKDNKVVEKWSNGLVRTNVYDDSGRIIKRSDSDKKEETFVYDDNGNYTVTNNYGEKRFFNSSGQIQRLISPSYDRTRNYVFNYEYKDDKLAKVTRDGAPYEETTYNEDGSYSKKCYWRTSHGYHVMNYNSHGNVETVYDANNNLLEKYNLTYDNKGRMVRRESDDKKVWTTVTYNNDGSYTVKESDGSVWKYNEHGVLLNK